MKISIPLLFFFFYGFRGSLKSVMQNPFQLHYYLIRIMIFEYYLIFITEICK